MASEVSTQTGGSEKSFHEHLDELRAVVEENLRYTKSIHQFTPKENGGQLEALQKTAAETLNYTKACYTLLHKMHRAMVWQRVLGGLKLVVVVGVLVASYVALEPWLAKSWGQMQEVLQQFDRIKATWPPQ